jgi:NADPH:quinone reductase-like Zn-dependent oxidoreductase
LRGRVCEGPADLLGQDVWGSGGDLGIGRDGTHAEYLALPRDGVALRPRALSAEEAAAVGVPFLTAWAALIDRGGLQAGEWVLIAGAAGAVGSAAIQLAAARHAQVIALVRTTRDDARVDAQNVAAIAHTEPNDVAAVVRETTGGTGAHLAINPIGGSLFQPLLDVLAAEGRMVCFSAMGGRRPVGLGGVLPQQSYVAWAQHRGEYCEARRDDAQSAGAAVRVRGHPPAAHRGTVSAVPGGGGVSARRQWQGRADP